MSVGEYCQLKLEPITQDLLNGVARDAAGQNIELTNKYDKSHPAGGLTPNELGWFNRHIAQKRSIAISSINNQAKQMRLDGNDQGIFAPIERSQAERHYNDRLKFINEDFFRKNSALVRDYEEKDRDYRRHKNAENGREAKTPSNWVIWGALFPLVLIPEALLNFETFRKVPLIKSDAVALGITILVGLAIAVASHNVGKFIRQYSYFTRADDYSRKNSGWPMIWLGLALLIVALSAVAYGRFYYLGPLIQQALILGQTPPNMVLSIFGMLAGNMICFLLGASFAYMLHDPNPEYEDAAKQRKIMEGQIASLRKSMIDKPASEALRRYKSDENDIGNKQRVMEGNPAYANLMTQFEQIKSKDHEVSSTLQNYRQHLSALLQEREGKFEFSMRDFSGNPLRPIQSISLSEYQTYPINLFLV